MTKNYDSVIFDMDGPLWDAVDSYCRVWNATIAETKLDVPEVTRRQLCELMGTPLESILHNLLDGSDVDPDNFLRRLLDNECRMMPELGGRLYEGVRPTLQRLHDSGTRMFMVSNCGPDGLTNFLAYTGLSDFFTETLSFGATGVEKDVNIRRLVACYNLKAPLYVGDTAGDCRSSHAAGIDFAWARYGFGHHVSGAEHTIDSITQLCDIVAPLK